MAGDDFYRVTEPLWDRLIEEGEFATFARTLDACEKMLKRRTLRPKLAFYVHMLRLAMWKAPAHWMQERINFIEAHGSELGGGMDDEIELLRALFKYRHQDREQIANTAVGAKVDQLIAAYCSSNSQAALSRITFLCDELGRNGNGWQQAFPARELRKYQDTLWLCMLILGDVAQQTGADFGHIKEQRLQQQADAAVTDIVKTIDEVSSRIVWLRARKYALPFLVYWLGPLILTYGWSFWPQLFLVWTLLAGLSYAALAVPFYLKKKVQERIEKLIEKEYESLWRPRMFRYVQACHAPPQLSIAQLQKSAAEFGHSHIVEVVLSFAFGDRAMHLFSLLQLFVH